MSHNITDYAIVYCPSHLKVKTMNNSKSLFKVILAVVICLCFTTYVFGTCIGENCTPGQGTIPETPTWFKYFEKVVYICFFIGLIFLINLLGTVVQVKQKQYCRKCNIEIEDDREYCPKCGLGYYISLIDKDGAPNNWSIVFEGGGNKCSTFGMLYIFLPFVFVFVLILVLIFLLT